MKTFGKESEHSAGRVALACALYAGAHSLLAAKPVKALARRTLGDRYRDGLYRLFYNGQSVGLLVLAARWFARQPDREIYRAGPALWRLMRLGQVASLGTILWGVLVVGLPRFSGFRQALALLAGRGPEPEPEAQGPILGPDGEIARRGPFRFSRHPSNWGFAAALLLVPRMTVNRAVVALFATAHAVLGSLHEERRLREAYGEAFERYKREVPFLLRFRPKG